MMTTDEKIWTYLKNQGFTDAGVAGLMGNLYAESGLLPNNLQNTYEKKLGYTDATYTAAVDNGSYTNFAKDGAGYGLAQWTYHTRKAALLAFAQDAGKSVGDLEVQLGFLMKELSESFKSVLNTLKTVTTVKAASDSVLLNFERPADQSDAVKTKRASYGQTYYNKYAVKGDVNVMKYTSSNPPMQCFMRQSTWYKGAGTVPVKGVLWHSTGANNPTLKRYVQPDDNAADRAKMLELLGTNPNKNDWNHISYNAGVNAWIGKLASGEVTTVQVGPWDKKAWGCGSGSKGSCNDGWIQFEICEDALTDKTYFEKVYQEAVELTAYLCNLYGLDPQGTVTYNGVKVPVILCHQDSYQLKLGSNHGDVLHWLPKFGKSMQTVRDDVAALLGGASSGVSSGNGNTGTSGTTSVAPSTPTTSTVTEKKATASAQRFDGAIAGAYKVTANSGLHVRNDSKTTAQSLVVLPKGTVVQNYGYFNNEPDGKWLYVQVTYGGIKYTGFSSAQYLSK